MEKQFKVGQLVIGQSGVAVRVTASEGRGDAGYKTFCGYVEHSNGSDWTENHYSTSWCIRQFN